MPRPWRRRTLFKRGEVGDGGAGPQDGAGCGLNVMATAARSSCRARSIRETHKVLVAAVDAVEDADRDGAGPARAMRASSRRAEFAHRPGPLRQGAQVDLQCAGFDGATGGEQEAPAAGPNDGALGLLGDDRWRARGHGIAMCHATHDGSRSPAEDLGKRGVTGAASVPVERRHGVIEQFKQQVVVPAYVEDVEGAAFTASRTRRSKDGRSDCSLPTR